MFERLTAVTAIGGVAALTLGFAFYLAGARVNTTRSIPLGPYWTTSAPVEKGQYVIVCPPNASVFHEAKKRGYIAAGLCTGDYGYIMKRVLAVEGDVIAITSEGVRVNGHLLSLSAPLKADRVGRSLPRYQSNPFTLEASEVLLMSDASSISFDSRYFGPVKRAQIRGGIRPVLTWK